MTFVNRDGLKYETVVVITQAYQPAKPAIEAVAEVPPQPAVEPKDAVQPTYDADGNELTPYIPPVPGQPGVQGVPGSPYVPAVPEVPELTAVVETGRIVGIEVAISDNRKVELLSVVEENDLEMIVQARIKYYAEDGETLMTDWIDQDQTLSEDAKALQKQRFAPYTMAPKSTRDSWVDPATGDLVEATAPGAVREIFFYQQLTRTNLTEMGVAPSTERRQQFLRYLMLKFMLLVIAQRAGI
ncbi:hypothetical protein [Fibrella forsythiae]|uniref:Uncharacterized protein n=1 Tax=Fibrella forsythiae TaxID=2817061 RepID=A0ABS3JB62_9BACT|nr:hypothetical protein [Fibrella forsythiae]MBO0947230.1 hypothetical protein [Fibrella forsythiae]